MHTSTGRPRPDDFDPSNDDLTKEYDDNWLAENGFHTLPACSEDDDPKTSAEDTAEEVLDAMIEISEDGDTVTIAGVESGFGFLGDSYPEDQIHTSVVLTPEQTGLKVNLELDVFPAKGYSLREDCCKFVLSPYMYGAGGTGIYVTVGDAVIFLDDENTNPDDGVILNEEGLPREGGYKEGIMEQRANGTLPEELKFEGAISLDALAIRKAALRAMAKKIISQKLSN